MEEGVDKRGRPVIRTGARHSVVCAVTAGGKSPAQDFLNQLEDKWLRKFWAIFLRICGGEMVGMGHFKKEAVDIWAFKRGQYRIACFRDGDSWVLTHGFVKKQDKWPKREFNRANVIMREDKARH